MASTTKGIVYPTSGDNVAPLETHFASLAQSADDAIGDLAVTVTEVDTAVDTLRADIGVIPKAGTYSLNSPTSTTVPASITVTLPGGHFTTAPIVVATVSGTSGSGAYFPVIHSTTTSQFQANVWRSVANASLGTITVTIASPAVVTDVGHGLSNGDLVYFTTTGALPTGILAGSTTSNNYFVRNVTADTFNLSATVDGDLINTSGTQSGTHTGFKAALEPIVLNWIAK
jgi:hypothetical protein